jgi:hypothetical protein
VNIENTGTGSALRANANSGAATVTLSNQNTSNGTSMWAESRGTGATIGARNTGTGGALYLENSDGNTSTLFIDAKGGATALHTRSTSQNGVWFDNVGTGNNIGILGTSRGLWPTAQFHNQAGGPALYAIGRAQVDGNVQVNGNLQINGNYAATGTKNAVVPTSSGTREMYTEEATEVWFADYGEAALTDSVVWVPFDATFAETIESGRPYHVFLQAYADASIFVSRRTAEGFEVRVRGDRAANQKVEFSYRLVAKRRGYGDRRLRPHAATPTDGVATPGARQ